MDAATKPPWMGSRRPRTPTVPRHPTECALLLLLLLLLLPAGAGLQALQNTPYPAITASISSALRARPSVSTR
ncbi:hypothetical protein D7Y57_10125 [Stenotrophomonas maltophilia]|nr:hypothetical protein [Stenotrophomonas maltophilia]